MQYKLAILTLMIGILAGYALNASISPKFGSGTQTVTFPGNLVVGGTTAFTGGIQAGAINATSVSTTGLIVGQGTNVDLWIAASSTIDVNNLTSGASTSSNVTVAGASVADSVLITPTGAWDAPTSSVSILGSVSSAGKVTIYFHNTSSTAVNLTNAVYDVDVFSH